MERKLTALIVEDEVKAVALLQKLLEDTMQFSSIETACSTDEAFQKLKIHQPDLLFLDIKMPKQNGFSFLKDLTDNGLESEVVFVTAYDKFALQAIKKHAFDYLLKPVDRKELSDCINQYKSRKMGPLLHGKLEIITTGTVKPKLKINTRTGYLFLDPANILSCRADGNYTHIDLGDQQHLCSVQLGVIESRLQERSFIRLGRSLIVNFNLIIKVDRKSGMVIFEKNSRNYPLQISKSQMKELETRQGR